VKRLALATVLLLTLPGAMCSTPQAGFPSREDVIAVTEAKPKPAPEVLTDATANDRYNSALEGWGDRLHAAGVRLCKFYNRTGMPQISCPKD